MERTDPMSIKAWRYKEIALSDERSHRKEKNDIYIAIYNQYLPYVNRQFNNLSKDISISECEFKSIYSDLILYALDKWSGACKFLNYLHTNLLGLKRLARRYVSVVDNDKHYLFTNILDFCCENKY